MRYVITDKNSGEIIYTNKSSLSEGLRPGEVYKDFNDETMNFTELSSRYKVENDRVVEKTDEELVEEGIIRIQEPFVYLDEDRKLSHRTLERVLEENLLKTKSQCEEALRIVGFRIEYDLKQKYSPGYELKLIRGYLLWLTDGKPENDKRETKFIDFSQEVKKIKIKYDGQRGKIKKIMKKIK